MKIGVADYGINVWDGGLFDIEERLEGLKSIGYEGTERLVATSASEAPLAEVAEDGGPRRTHVVGEQNALAQRPLAEWLVRLHPREQRCPEIGLRVDERSEGADHRIRSEHPTEPEVFTLEAITARSLLDGVRLSTRGGTGDVGNCQVLDREPTVKLVPTDQDVEARTIPVQLFIVLRGVHDPRLRLNDHGAQGIFEAVRRHGRHAMGEVVGRLGHEPITQRNPPEILEISKRALAEAGEIGTDPAVDLGVVDLESTRVDQHRELLRDAVGAARER